MRAFEYRLVVKKHQAQLLMECLKETRIIYNEMLEYARAQYEETGTFPGKHDLETAFKGRGAHVPATTVQLLADRLSKSLKRFLSARQNNIPGIGFPRFEQPDRCDSIQLRQYGKDVYLHEDKKHLIVPRKIGHSLKIKLHRPVEGTPRRVYLVHPQAMVNLLTLLYNGQILTTTDRDLALNLMEKIEPDQQVGVGNTTPPGATVAMKDGWVPAPDGLWAMNSSGIITLGQETYIVAVYSQESSSLEDGQAIVQHICGAIASLLT